MATIFFEKRGCNTNENEFLNHRVITQIITKDGKRMFLEFSHFDKCIYRYKNKKTGARLKTPILTDIDRNALTLSNTYYEQEAHGGISDTWENGWGDCSLYDLANDKHFNFSDVLSVVNQISKYQYDNIDFCDNLETCPQWAEIRAEWEKIKEQENAQALNKHADNVIRDVSRDIEFYMNKSINKTTQLQKRITEIFYNVTEQERERVLEIAKNGGYRERALTFCPYNAVVKVYSTNKEHNIFRLYNLMPTADGTLNYCEIDLATGKITG